MVIGSCTRQACEAAITVEEPARNGNIELVQILLATGADVDAPAADSEEETESSAYCIRGTACVSIEM